jgi:hypothetical protein
METGRKAGRLPERPPITALTLGICRFNRIAVTGKCGGRGFATLLVNIQCLSIASRKTSWRANSSAAQEKPSWTSAVSRNHFSENIRARKSFVKRDQWNRLRRPLPDAPGRAKILVNERRPGTNKRCLPRKIETWMGGLCRPLWPAGPPSAPGQFRPSQKAAMRRHPSARVASSVAVLIRT